MNEERKHGCGNRMGKKGVGPFKKRSVGGLRMNLISDMTQNTIGEERDIIDTEKKTRRRAKKIIPPLRKPNGLCGEQETEKNQEWCNESNSESVLFAETGVQGTAFEKRGGTCKIGHT